MLRYLLIPLAAAAFVLGGCGDDDDSNAPGGAGASADAGGSSSPSGGGGAQATPTPKPDPCTLLNADQVKDAIGTAPSGMLGDLPDGRTCVWTEGAKVLLVAVRDGADAKKDFEAAGATAAAIGNFVSNGQQLPAHRTDADGKTTVRVLRGERLVQVELTSAEDISRLIKARSLAQIVLGQ